MDIEKYVEERLTKIYKKAFIVAGIEIALFIIGAFIFMKSYDIGSWITLLLALCFLYTVVFGYIIMLKTKKSIIKIVLIPLSCFFILIGMIHTISKIYYTNYHTSLMDRDYGPSTVEIEQYNAEFTQYDGMQNVRGSNIQQLIKNVLTHNGAYSDDSSMWINVNVVETGNMSANTTNNAEAYNDITAFNNTHIGAELKKVKTTRTYKVECGYDKVTGYVVDIVIVQNDRYTNY